MLHWEEEEVVGDHSEATIVSVYKRKGDKK